MARTYLSSDDLQPMPPTVAVDGEPAWLLQWRRDRLLGRWWGLCSWLSTRQLPFGEPEHRRIDRWIEAERIEPVDGEDYTVVPRVVEPEMEVSAYPRARGNRIS